MVAEGVEVIVGVSYDAQVGPVLLFGGGSPLRTFPRVLFAWHPEASTPLIRPGATDETARSHRILP
jgi:hypothetical protein